MSEWRMQDGAVRVDGERFAWAKYDAAGARLAASANADAALLAAWDAEAATTAPAMAMAHAAKVAERQTRERVERETVKARFDGVCAVTGRRFRRGAAIRRTAAGWAIAGAATTAPVNDELAADEADAFRAEMATAAREQAAGDL